MRRRSRRSAACRSGACTPPPRSARTVAFAALARNDGSLRIADLRSGVTRDAPARHDAPVQSMAFSRDGSTLVTGPATTSGRRVGRGDALAAAVFEGHAGPIDGVALARRPHGLHRQPRRHGHRLGLGARGDSAISSPSLQATRRRVLRERGCRQTPPPTISASRREATRWRSATPTVPEHGRRPDAPGRRPRPRRTQALGAPGTFAPDGRTIAITTGPGALGFWDSPRPPVAEAPGVLMRGGRCWRRSTAPTAAGSP